MKLQIGIVEDETEIREGVAILINGNDNFSCKNTFSNSEDAIAQIPTLGLDVVLMDIHLPGKSGVECVTLLKPLCPATQFLMFTSYEDTDSVFKALQAGATGYLNKTTPPSKLLEALLDVYNGGSPMSSHIARKIVTSFQPAQSMLASYNLSPREQEVLNLLSKGLRYKEIADQLFISTETVRKHIRNIYEKLQVQSRTEALNKIFPRN
jgi:DNA-binding NarL/FixJ family response regulator